MFLNSEFAQGGNKPYHYEKKGMYEGNLRKMKSSWKEGIPVTYSLNLYDVLEKKEEIPLNACIGKTIKMQFDGTIHCVVSGKKIPKSFGEGMSFEAFKNAAENVESIIRPELSQAHLGIGLRDLDWEIEHHVKPHYVYLSFTGGLKVGVTRATQIPSRWIDQGAIRGLILAETPYRQAAGLMEVALKAFASDKTDWKKMLCCRYDQIPDMQEEKRRLLRNLPYDLKDFVLDEEPIHHIEYPVLSPPQNVKSISLDEQRQIEKKLIGIKGQYLIFEDETVLNIRSHAGYRIQIEC